MVRNHVTVQALPASGPKVLIVEDDVLIRASTAQYLRDSGFEVIEAASVDEAVSMLGVTPDLRLSFIDLKLQGTKTGLDLLDIIERDYPGVRMLFTTGVMMADALVRRGFPVLRKPYFLFEVERRIRSMLPD